MIRRALPAIVTLTVRKTVTTPVQGSAPPTVAAADQTPRPSVPQDTTEYGAGLIVDRSGIIATNFHVVDGAWDVIATLADGTKTRARLLQATRLVDVALLKIDVGHDLPVVTWGDSDAVQVGQQALAIGDPQAVGISVTGGIVSALNRNISDSPYDDFIQTDAAINHGNSGGPLVNLAGEVIGMATAFVSPTKSESGLGFAIPSRSVQRIIARLQEFGWLRPGWIGIRVQEISVGVARAFALPRVEGDIVADLTADSPAIKAGLRVGDIITRVDGTPPADERALLRTIATAPIGQALRFTLVRDGQTMELPVTVAEWPRAAWEKLDPPVKMPPARPISADLGILLAPATPMVQAMLEIPALHPGVAVTAVGPATDAADRGLVPGDIIARVMGQDVATPAEVQQQIDAARTAGRDFIALLVWRKAPGKAGPEWLALRVARE